MHHYRRAVFRLAASALFVSAVMFAGAQQVRNVIDIDVPSARGAGVGGAHVTTTEDLSQLFHNPAGFVSASPQLSLSEVSVGMSGPIFDITSLVIEAVGPSGITTVLSSPAVQDLVSGIYAKLVVGGPVYFGYIGDGLGFGFFNITDLTFTNPAPLVLKAVIGEQIILAGGYGFRLPVAHDTGHTFDLGILLKGSLRGEVSLTRSLLQLPDLLTSFGIDTIMGGPFKVIAGIGGDAGFRYGFRDNFAFAVVGKDLFTPTLVQAFDSLEGFLDNTSEATVSRGREPIDLTAGIMISPVLGRLGRVISDLNFYLDYRDALDFLIQPAAARNPVLHLGLGLDLQLLEILTLRAGFSEGLFAAGLGIDLAIFRLQMAMYGRELSSEPGLRPVFNAQVDLEFRL